VLELELSPPILPETKDKRAPVRKGGKEEATKVTVVKLTGDGR
jgi:hypothetical protein